MPLRGRAGSDVRGRIGDVDAALDVTGAIIASAAAGWAVVSWRLEGGSAGPVAALLVGSVAAALVAHRLALIVRWIVPALIAGGTLLLIAARLGGSFPSRALSGALGYDNASAALYLQAGAAALMVFAWWEQRYGLSHPMAVAGLLVFGLLAIAALDVNSRAVDALLALPLLALIPRRHWAVRATIAACGAVSLLALIVTVVLGLTYSPRGPASGVGGLAYRDLSSARPALWHDALNLMGSHPMYGVGPARFQVVSPIGSSDRDVRWAHNGFLQQGAEEGLIGLALLVALFVWGFVRLWLSAGPDRLTALAAAALAALSVQACIDYVLHFMALPLLAAALVGVGAAGIPSLDRSTEGRYERGFART